MTKSKNLPTQAVPIATYADLEQYAQAFAAGHLNLLILCGGPGLGKSQCLRRALAGTASWIDGNASAFGIYLQAHEHRDQPLVLDDVDGLYRDRQGIRLLNWHYARPTRSRPSPGRRRQRGARASLASLQPPAASPSLPTSGKPCKRTWLP